MHPDLGRAHSRGQAFESPSSLLVALDGETNGGKPNETLIPIPQIVENLKAADQIPPTVVVLVGSVDGATRTRNLRGSEPFADFLSQELVPWVRSHYRAGLDPAHTVIAGQSHGGLAAAHAAFHHPTSLAACSHNRAHSGTRHLSATATRRSTTPRPAGSRASSPRLPLRPGGSTSKSANSSKARCTTWSWRIDVFETYSKPRLSRDLLRIPRRPRLRLLAWLDRRWTDHAPGECGRLS